MIEQKDLKYESRIVDLKTGADLFALYYFKGKDGEPFECVYAIHDFNSNKITDTFKEEALYAIRRKMDHYKQNGAI